MPLTVYSDRFADLQSTSLVTIAARIASENNDSGIVNVYILLLLLQKYLCLCFSWKRTKGNLMQLLGERNF